MTEHNDKQVASADAAAHTAPLKGRRRLVKGAMLAMPAVMTLRSGAALAAASSRCQANTGGADPNKFRNNPDEFLRAEVDFRIYENSAGNRRRFYFHENEWRRANNGNPTDLDDFLANNPDYILTSASNETRLGLVYVDDNGTAVGVANSQSGDITTPSCLVSFF